MGYQSEKEKRLRRTALVVGLATASPEVSEGDKAKSVVLAALPSPDGKKGKK